MQKLALLIALFGLAAVTPAQVETRVPSGMQALEFLLGEWSGTLKMTFPGSNEPVDVPTVVKVKEFGPFHETVYTLTLPDGGSFTGHMFTTWDEPAKVYKSWTFDDNTNEPRTEKGSFDGKKYVMVSDPHGGTVTRVTFEYKSPKEVGFLLEMKQGDEYQVLGKGTYTKKS